MVNARPRSSRSKRPCFFLRPPKPYAARSCTTPSQPHQWVAYRGITLPWLGVTMVGQVSGYVPLTCFKAEARTRATTHARTVQLRSHTLFLGALVAPTPSDRGSAGSFDGDQPVRSRTFNTRYETHRIAAAGIQNHAGKVSIRPRPSSALDAPARNRAGTSHIPGARCRRSSSTGAGSRPKAHAPSSSASCSRTCGACSRRR